MNGGGIDPASLPRGLAQYFVRFLQAYQNDDVTMQS